MEESVLIRYQHATAGSSKQQRTCCDELTYKYHIIRYNLYFQTRQFDRCVYLFRELACHEAQYEFDFERSNFLFMVVHLHKTPTAATVKSLTDGEIMVLVKLPLELGHGHWLDEPQARVQLKRCAACNTEEDVLHAFKNCRRCKKVAYCGKKCQKQHWKAHKKVPRWVPKRTFSFEN